MTTTPAVSTLPPGLANLQRIGAGLGVIGILLLLAAWAGKLVVFKTLMQSYLWAWIIGMLFALGCYGCMLLHHICRGDWGKPVLRMFEAGAKMLPVMFVLFLPIYLGRHELYPWADAAKVAQDESLRHRAPYMND